jgi:hypothetical protein
VLAAITGTTLNLLHQAEVVVLIVVRFDMTKNMKSFVKFSRN